MKSFLKPLLIALAATAWLGSSAVAQQNNAKDKLGRVKYDVKYLASDELEGRGVETEGIHKAADYIVQEFKKYGVKPGDWSSDVCSSDLMMALSIRHWMIMAGLAGADSAYDIGAATLM